MRGKSPSIVTSAGRQVIADNWKKKKCQLTFPTDGVFPVPEKELRIFFFYQEQDKKIDITSEVTETRWGSRHHLLAVWHEAENLTFFES